MPDIPDLIAMLESPIADKRYDACEELRVMPRIPQDAEAALQGAMKDPDPLVADAAARAFRLHTSPPAPPAPSDNSTSVPQAPIGRLDLSLAAVGLGVTVLSAPIAYSIFWLLQAPPNEYNWESLAESIGVLSAVPFHVAPLMHPVRFLALLCLVAPFMVAPSCALLLRGRPKVGIVVIVTGLVSGVLYDIAALVAFVGLHLY